MAGEPTKNSVEADGKLHHRTIYPPSRLNRFEILTSCTLPSAICLSAALRKLVLLTTTRIQPSPLTAYIIPAVWGVRSDPLHHKSAFCMPIACHYFKIHFKSLLAWLLLRPIWNGMKPKSNLYRFDFGMKPPVHLLLGSHRRYRVFPKLRKTEN